MSYEFYKVIHMTSLFAVFVALGGINMHMLNKGQIRFPFRRWAMLWHGIGLALVMISGFGLMLRTGIPHDSWPMWIYVKLVIWLFLGGVTALMYRIPRFGKWYWVLVIALGGLAALMANLKIA